MSISLLSTKLHIPRPVWNGVSRPRLTEKLNTAVHRPGNLVLVSGPAGFGKTTLLSEFAANRVTRWHGSLLVMKTMTQSSFGAM